MKKRILSHGLILALAASSTASVLLTGCTKTVPLEEYDKTVVASYNGWDITMAEANYLCRIEQHQMEELYTYYDLGDVDWSEEYEGTTLENYDKNRVMEKLLQTALLCSKAQEYGVSLSEEDKEKIATGVENTRKNYSDFFVEQASASEEVVTKVYTNNALANRVWEYMAKDIDLTVNEEDFLHKTCDYLLLRGIKEDDPDGITVPSEEGKEEASSAESKEEASSAESAEGSEPKERETDLVKVMENVEKEFENGKSLEELKEELIAEGYDALVSYETIGKNELDKHAFSPTAFALSEGEHATFDAGNDGVYLFCCKDDDNEQAKQDAIEGEYANRRTALFEENYKKLTESVEPYTLNVRLWRGIRFDVKIYTSPTPSPETESGSGKSAEGVTEAK